MFYTKTYFVRLIRLPDRAHSVRKKGIWYCGLQFL